MKLRNVKYCLTDLLHARWWKSAFKYFRGTIRQFKGRYIPSNNDFYWVLNYGTLRDFESLVHENLGINHAHLEDFNKAEFHLLKSLEDSTQNTNVYLLMWLGYVLLVKEKYEESIYYYKKAREIENKGINKLVAQPEYVKERIDELEGSVREKYKEIFTDN